MRTAGRAKTCPLQSLAAVNKELAAEMLIPIIKTIPADVDEPYWKSEAANWIHVANQLDDIEVWLEYLKATKRANVGLRMEMMNPICYPTRETNKDIRIAFVATFLNDNTVRDVAVSADKFDGPCAAFTIKRITVRDFATMKLASMMLKLDEYPDANWTQRAMGRSAKTSDRRVGQKGIAGPFD